MSHKRRFFYDTEFIERPSTIDLISIGIVGEDGSEFYAVSTDAEHSKANQWVKDNVLMLLPPEDDSAWCSREVMRARVLDFLRPSKTDKVELWGYYSAYDHVALCWLFGPMVDLPPGMPMYTRDAKQLCDSLGNPRLPPNNGAHDALVDARWTRSVWQLLTAVAQRAAAVTHAP